MNKQTTEAPARRSYGWAAQTLGDQLIAFSKEQQGWTQPKKALSFIGAIDGMEDYLSRAYHELLKTHSNESVSTLACVRQAVSMANGPKLRMSDPAYDSGKTEPVDGFVRKYYDYAKRLQVWSLTLRRGTFPLNPGECEDFTTFLEKVVNLESYFPDTVPSREY